MSKIIGISENKGDWWMKRNMNDFYIENAGKEKNRSCSSTDRIKNYEFLDMSSILIEITSQ